MLTVLLDCCSFSDRRRRLDVNVNISICILHANIYSGDWIVDSALIALLPSGHIIQLCLLSYLCWWCSAVPMCETHKIVKWSFEKIDKIRLVLRNLILYFQNWSPDICRKSKLWIFSKAPFGLQVKGSFQKPCFIFDSQLNLISYSVLNLP